MARNRVFLSDFIIALTSVWLRALSMLFVHKFLGVESDEFRGEIIKGILYVSRMFFTEWLGMRLGGGRYNPLTVLYTSISGKSSRALSSISARIPAQVIGSITGARLITKIFPEIGNEPLLKVDILRGALIEGVLTYAIVVISLEAAQNHSSNFLLETWTSSICRLALHLLGSDLTGGCMNPAFAIGQAFAQGGYINKDHIFVYWLAPIEATLLGVWTFKSFIQTKDKQEEKQIWKTKFG
uniref:Aquaporin SIP2-1 n=1 Tax=Nelumbo nucifera TaxID=4432 RepID=A0A822ZMU9_NELNU|nr:TPA_asm: hypothetical protein HUJ06_001338 [Nelumbo nucifera]